MRRQRPVFIVIEGLDGVGKSTVARSLARRLRARLLRTPPAQLQRQRPVIESLYAASPLARMAWYAAADAYVSEAARRCLGRGRSVVLDRYWLSTVAYARLRATGCALRDLERALLRPDATVYLRAPVGVRRQRVRHRGAGSAEDRATLRPPVADQLDRAFRQLGQRSIAGRFLVLDVGALSQRQVVRLVLAALRRAGVA